MLGKLNLNTKKAFNCESYRIKTYLYDVIFKKAHKFNAFCKIFYIQFSGVLGYSKKNLNFINFGIFLGKF